MKKVIFLLGFLMMVSFATHAQRFAYVNTEYILGKVPEYKEAQKKLDEIAAGWKTEIDAKFQEVATMYEKFSQEEFLLTEDMKRKREEEIIAKEEEANKLQKARFGYEGELYKKRQELVQPIQDKIFDAIQKLATTRGYDFIFDKASGGATLLYTNPSYDLSDQVLKNLGYN